MKNENGLLSDREQWQRRAQVTPWWRPLRKLWAKIILASIDVEINYSRGM